MGNAAGDRALEVDYPLAFGNAFSKSLTDGQKKFRYIHLSGGHTERDQGRSLWFKSAMRKMKGENENNMLAFATKPSTPGLWETLIVKAAFVIRKESTGTHDILGWMLGKNSIVLDELAAFMIDAALHGWEDSTISDNQMMVQKGRQMLGKI